MWMRNKSKWPFEKNHIFYVTVGPMLDCDRYLWQRFMRLIFFSITGWRDRRERDSGRVRERRTEGATGQPQGGVKCQGVSEESLVFLFPREVEVFNAHDGSDLPLLPANAGSQAPVIHHWTPYWTPLEASVSKKCCLERLEDWAWRLVKVRQDFLFLLFLHFSTLLFYCFFKAFPKALLLLHCSFYILCSSFSSTLSDSYSESKLFVEHRSSQSKSE